MISMMGNGFRIEAGDEIIFRSIASRAVTIRCHAGILFDDGETMKVELSHTSSSTRATVSSTSPRIPKSGWVVGCDLEEPVGNTHRGQIYARAYIRGVSQTVKQYLAAGYLYDEWDPTLGVFRESQEGKGYLDWVQEANDAAGSATTTVNLATDNARRIVRGVIIKYHSSGDAATRTLTITLRDLADSGGPTGWSIASDTWVSPTLTLTVNEEGLIHVGEHGFVSTNDAGTLAYADNSSAPNPFPLELEEGDTADLIIAAGSGHANDDYDVWVQYEEWLIL